METLKDSYAIYKTVWEEPQNQTARETLRRRIEVGKTCIITLEPGDGTRYRFLLLLTPDIEHEISHERNVNHLPVDSRTLLVTVLDGLGSGVVSIGRTNRIEGIRHRIADKLDIRNKCTAEALAQTINAVWAIPN